MTPPPSDKITIAAGYLGNLKKYEIICGATIGDVLTNNDLSHEGYEIWYNGARVGLDTLVEDLSTVLLLRPIPGRAGFFAPAPNLSYGANLFVFWRAARRDFLNNVKYGWPIFALLLLYFLGSSCLFQLFEPYKTLTYPQSMYLTWVSMTTGFKDPDPQSTYGQLLVSANALAGLVLFGTIVWIVTTSIARR